MKTVQKILLVLLGAAVVCAALYTVKNLMLPDVEAVAWDDTVPTGAFSASAEDMGQTTEMQQALMDALPGAVLEAGGNTLYFAVNSSEGLCFSDKRFPADSRLTYSAVLGLVNRTYDALDRLDDACSKSGVRLVAVVDVNALAGGAAGDAALADGDFASDLQGLLRDMSRRYALSAVVLSFSSAPSDTTANHAVLSSISRQCGVPFGLELPAGNTLLTSQDTGVSLAVAQVGSDDDAAAAAVLAAADDKVLWHVVDAVSFSEAAYFAAGSGASMQNVIWCAAAQYKREPALLSALQASVSPEVLPGAAQVSVPEIPAGLAVSYPDEGAVLYTDEVYVMGMSDPAQTLTVNGTEVKRTSTNGVFGTAVGLEKGDNTILLTQGSTTLQLHVTRAESAGSWNVTERDATVPAYEGDRVRITEWICSLLDSPDSEDGIRETAKQGGVGVVSNCVTTVRNGKYTYAYELASGGWVLAYNCEPLAEGDSAGPWPLADFSVTNDDSGDEKLMLVSGAKALAYDAWDEEGGTLTVTLANTENTAGSAEYALSSVFCSGVACEDTDGGVKLTFTVAGDKKLWGYDVQYDDAGNTVLYLKNAPSLPLDGAQPLLGAVVLLDAGHGKDDFGAMGAAGALGGPLEKDVNLAVALAARARLEQLGATVVMVREDDSFLSLEERSQLAARTHPDLYLAIHHNSVELASDVSEVSGCSAYYFTLQGKLLADSLLGPVSTAAGRPDNGSNWSYFYVNRMTYTPSVLFEYGFLVNPAEYQACCDPAVILREGNATAQGILTYFRTRLAG